MVVDWASELRTCEDALGPAPRPVRDEWRLHLRPAERVAFAIDRLRRVVRAQDELLRHGRACWGHVVQANVGLFEEGNRKTLPADLAFDPAGPDADVGALATAAFTLFALKGTKPEDPALQPFARVLTDERERTDVRTIPASIAAGRKLLFTTVIVHPPHLPDGMLQSLPVPVVACPERTTAVMLLAASTWSETLRSLWTS